MAAFMWRRLLNNAVSTTIIHGELKKMVDGAYTQVGGLDDKQVYDHDSLKKNYIMWKTSQKGGDWKTEGEKREKE